MSHPTCHQPDRDAPKLVCGYPLPCPYHTATLDLGAKPVPTVTVPITSDAAGHLGRLGDITVALTPGKARRGRR
jgi:hypothetical protein